MGKEIIYMVTYVDDEYKKHLTFVRGFSAVRFLIDRFDDVHFEATERYVRIEE